MAAQTVIMASSSSLLSGRSATSKPFTGTPIKQTRAVAVPRCRQHVVASAAKEEQRGPTRVALGLFGALAAAQLALLPAGPAEAFSLFPKTAISQSARDKLNKKTSELPSLTETGSELVGGSDPIGADPQSAKDVGKTIAKNTPDAPDLTKNPKSLGKDAIKGVKNALPDVSYVPTKEDIIKKFRSNKGSAQSVAKGKAGNPLKGASNPLKGAGNPLKGASNPLKGGGDPLSGAKKALPSNPARDFANKAKTKTPSADVLKSKAAAQVPSADDIKGKLTNPLGALPDPKELVNKAKANAPNPDTLTSKAKANVPKPLADAKSKIKNSPAATIGLPAFELADLQGQNNQSQNYPSPGKDSFPLDGPLKGKGDSIPGPMDAAMDPPKNKGNQAPGTDLGVSSAKEVGQAAQDALPDAPKGNPIDAVKGLFQ